MAGFLEVVGSLMFPIGAILVFQLFKSGGTVFVESTAIALLGFGALIIAAGAALRRLDKIVAQSKKVEAAE
jgi:hypothetical protein